LDSNQWHLP